MTQLPQCLRDELVRRDYAASTIRSYVQIVEAFRQHTDARLDQITPAQLRRYHLFLLEERRLAIGTVVTQICALRFFCRYVLNRRDVREDLPYPKQRLRLPVVLSPDEVQRLIAAAKNLYHRTMLLTLYGAGLRRSELCHLKVRQRVETVSPWKVMTGRYTREGDVRPLLAARDDMFVVSRPGDEIALAFDATSLPSLQPGQTRTFLLYVVGYSKEMDINSASPHTVEPLPFHGMSAYPYGPAERYPQTPAHLEYLDRYNTRTVSRPLPPLEIVK